MKIEIGAVGRRVAAVGILMLVIWCVVAAAIGPFVNLLSGQRQWRDTVAEQGTTFLTLSARRPLMVEELADLKRRQDAASLLWKSSSDVALAAALEGLVRSFVPAGDQVMSVSSNAPFTDHSLRHVSVRFNASIELSTMARILSAIENARPRVFIDRLSITTPPSNDPALPPRITMECDLSAFAQEGHRS